MTPDINKERTGTCITITRTEKAVRKEGNFSVTLFRGGYKKLQKYRDTSDEAVKLAHRWKQLLPQEERTCTIHVVANFKEHCNSCGRHQEDPAERYCAECSPESTPL